MSDPTLPDDEPRLESIAALFGGIGMLSSEYGVDADSSVTESDYDEARKLLIEQLGGGKHRADVFITLFSRIGRNMAANEIATRLEVSDRTVDVQLDSLVDIGVINGFIFPAPSGDGQSVRYEVNTQHPFCADILDLLD